MKLFIYSIICYGECTHNYTVCENKTTSDKRLDKLMKDIESAIPDNCETDVECSLMNVYDFEFGKAFQVKNWPIKYTVKQNEDSYELIIDREFDGDEIYVAEFPLDGIHCEYEDEHSYIKRG